DGAHRNDAAPAGGTSVAARHHDAGGCGRDEAAPATLTGRGTARRRSDEEEARMGMAHGTARAAGRAPAARRTLDGSRDEVLRRHLPLVRQVVQRLAMRKPPHIDIDDLVSWGIVGLLDAIAKYDPNREAAFATYAQFRIRGAILDHLRSLDWVPRGVRQKASLIEKVSHQLEGALGRPPREEEIATELGLPLGDYQDLLTRVGDMALFSLDDLGFGSGEERLSLERSLEANDEDPLGALLTQ